MDLPNIRTGLSYPKRPSFFAVKYQRMLLLSGVLAEIKADGFALCSLVALTEDTRRYLTAPRFWTDQLCEVLAIKSRTTLGQIRDKCVKAGVLHYEPGRKSTAQTLWALWPKCWDGLGEGFMAANAVQNLDSISDGQIQSCPESEQETKNAVQNLDSNRTASRTHSFLDPNPTPTLLAVVVENGFGEQEKQIETQLLALGVAKAKETIRETLLNGTTLETMAAVIAYFSSRPGAWGPGALRRRLTLGSAQSLTSDQGWPPTSSRENQLRTKATIASDRAKVSADAKSTDDRKTKERQLEFDFGSILDAMPEEQLHKLVRENKPVLMPILLRDGRKSRLVRASLLGLMASISGPTLK
jgi:hypothetical protein